MDINDLISKRLEEAEEILKANKEKYKVEYTCGGKDADILKDMYVIRALRKPEGIILTLTGFKTKI
ncbi:hypothetical protein [Proteocatella sphenisci]|uniref:hypothetical protein n=1 Tax=Proteocatella sphenisci TaxID=181070 RepID=UPI00048AE4D0|nr:hypothetical protein [Proteocatella sphenisci]